MKQAVKKCKTPYCRNKAAKRRSVCHCCHKKGFAKEHPITYAFMNLRTNSKRRGIKFEIDLEYFTEFCIETGYMNVKGINKKSYTIDRIIEKRGYIKGNLQLLTKSDNSMKEIRRRLLKYDYQNKSGKYVDVKLFKNEAPF